MNSTLSDTPKTNSLISLNLDEITYIFDSLENPSLLISIHEKRIITGNLAMVEISGFTKEELRRLPIERLFPNLIDYIEDWETQLKLRSQKGINTKLITRLNSEIHVNLRSKIVGSKARFILLELNPPYKNSSDDDGSKNAQLQLINIYTQPTLEMALDIITQIGCNIIRAKATAIYELKENHPNYYLSNAYDEENIFPTTISESEVITYLSEPTLSPPFPAILSSLHKISMERNSSYLVTVPLKVRDRIIGIFVALGRSETTSYNTMDYLLQAKILASKAIRAIKNFSKIKELEQQVTSLSTINLISTQIRNHIPIGIIQLDPSLTIQHINHVTEEILGYAEMEILHRHFEDILIGKNRLSSHIHEALKGIPTHKISDLTLHHRDGSIIPVEMKIIPVMEPNSSNIFQVLVFIQDISREMEFKTQTQHLERRALIGDMNAIFSHEIRNPINNITSGVQLLKRNTPEDFDNHEVLQGILEDCDKLTNIVNTILCFSSNRNYNMAKFNLSALLKTILARWHPRMKHIGIDPHLSLDPCNPDVYGDKHALGQVFTNLIENAVHALEKTGGGTIAIRMREAHKSGEENYIQVDVLDTGSGIPVSARSRIFEPFFTTKSSGTGLGLAITKQIITNHKGTITVSHLPEGTVFHVSLPAFM